MYLQLVAVSVPVASALLNRDSHKVLLASLSSHMCHVMCLQLKLLLCQDIFSKQLLKKYR
jgi:hypothetical protein